jgi:hypothetical protein
VGNLVPVMSRSPDRCSTLERGSPRRNHGHAVPNPRMRACSTGVFGSCLLLCAPTIGAVRGGGVKNCAPPLESEHEKLERGILSLSYPVALSFASKVLTCLSSSSLML